jgi:hypothetical protein
MQSRSFSAMLALYIKQHYVAKYHIQELFHPKQSGFLQSFQADLKLSPAPHYWAKINFVTCTSFQGHIDLFIKTMYSK